MAYSYRCPKYVAFAMTKLGPAGIGGDAPPAPYSHRGARGRGPRRQGMGTTQAGFCSRRLHISETEHLLPVLYAPSKLFLQPQIAMYNEMSSMYNEMSSILFCKGGRRSCALHLAKRASSQFSAVNAPPRPLKPEKTLGRRRPPPAPPPRKKLPRFARKPRLRRVRLRRVRLRRPLLRPCALSYIPGAGLRPSRGRFPCQLPLWFFVLEGVLLALTPVTSSSSSSLPPAYQPTRRRKLL
jgi:hypothetical protein